MNPQSDTCCQCGMEKQFWSLAQGFEMEGARFCCQRCAEETGCRCEDNLRLARAATARKRSARGRASRLFKPR